MPDTARNNIVSSRGVVHRKASSADVDPWPACRTQATSSHAYFSTDKSITCTKCLKLS